MVRAQQVLKKIFIWRAVTGVTGVSTYVTIVCLSIFHMYAMSLPVDCVAGNWTVPCSAGWAPELLPELWAALPMKGRPERSGGDESSGSSLLDTGCTQELQWEHWLGGSRRTEGNPLNTRLYTAQQKTWEKVTILTDMSVSILKNTEKIPTFSRGLLICSGSSSNNTSLSDRDPDFCSRTQTGKVRGGPIVSPFMFTSLPHKHRSFLMIRAVQRTETNLAGSLSVLLFLCLIEPETESQI